MGDQHLLSKGRATLGSHIGGQADAGQGLEVLLVLGLQGEGNQTGPGRLELKAKLLRQLIAIGSGPQLGHGEASGGHHQRLALDAADAGGHGKPALQSAHRLNLGPQSQLHLALVALIQQHTHDLFGAVITEQLAVVSLVIGDVVAHHQIDKIPLGVLGQGGFDEVGIAAQVIGWLHIEVGEVAAATATDQDLLTRLLGMVDDHHLTTAGSGGCGTHQSGGTGADHQHLCFKTHHFYLKTKRDAAASLWNHFDHRSFYSDLGSRDSSCFAASFTGLPS